MKNKSIIIGIVLVIAIVILGIAFFMTKDKSYNIKIKIPAGGSETFAYSDAEISPKSDTITIAPVGGLGDFEIILMPVEAKEENTYEPIHLTLGTHMKIDAEKGAWFKIGVKTQNPTNQDLDVYVSVSNINIKTK